MEIVKYLLSNGANVNRKDKEGRLPIHYIYRVTNINICKILLARKSNVNTADRYGKLPLHYGKLIKLYTVLQVSPFAQLIAI